MPYAIPSVVRRQTIADILRRTALRLPKKTAIVCGSSRWTYAEFDALVSRLAAGYLQWVCRKARGSRYSLAIRMGSQRFALRLHGAAQ